MRRNLLSTLALVAVCCAAINAHAGEKDGGLDIYWIDVEGGAATLLVTPSGETILVDTGNPGRRDSSRIFKVASEVVGARKIDHLIVTHYHLDHFGGAVDLAKLVPLGTVYDNGDFAGMPERPDKSYREVKCERRQVINPGDKLELRAAEGESRLPVEIQCLATRQQTIAGPAGGDGADNAAVCATHRPKDRDGSDNANSVVLLVSFGDFRFFDAGDLTWNVEEKLVCPRNLVGKVDVYQTTHHGLEASNNPVVLASLEPIVAVMNNGARKGSDRETVATLRESKSLAAAYQVHKNVRDEGKTNATSDEFIANVGEKCEGNYIHLRVAPDGKSYTVSIPATRHTKRYETRKR